jgi:hypothetical protein
MAAGLPLSTDADATALWRAFVERQVARRSGAEQALREVIDADPGLAVAHAAALLLTAFDAAGFDPAEEWAAARAARADQPWERSFTEATLTMHSQGIWPARPSWVRHHRQHPADLLGLSVAAFLAFTSTEPEGPEEALGYVRATAAAVGEHPVLVGYEAMHAQDQGRLEEAHALAVRALELDPTGFSGGHPLAHVYFEGGDHLDGIAWLDEWLPTTDREAPFGGHLVWHSALHHLAVGDRDGALERYRHCASRPGAGGLVDGTSMLWRCQMHGLVAERADPSDTPVAPMVGPLLDGVPSTFVGVHVALGLATAGDAEALRRLATKAGAFTAPGAAELLPGLARGLAAYVEGDHATASERLLAEEAGFGRYGGSHAQREVFEDTLLQALTRAGRYDEATSRLRRRLDRRESRLDAGLLARVTAAG